MLRASQDATWWPPLWQAQTSALQHPLGLEGLAGRNQSSLTVLAAVMKEARVVAELEPLVMGRGKEAPCWGSPSAFLFFLPSLAECN